MHSYLYPVLNLFLMHTAHTHTHTPTLTHIVKVINKENWGSSIRLDPPSLVFIFFLFYNSHLSGNRVQDAASGQCSLPEDALPWLFLRAHTCMLSPLSICSLTFGTVKIEDMSCSSQSRGGRLLKYSWFSAAWADRRFFGKHWRNLEANSSAWST